MKKLSRFVTLLLVIALVFSMSAVALAEEGAEEGKVGDNECTVKVKVNVSLDPFVEWTFPSEIIISLDPSGSTYTASLAKEDYAIVVSDALISEKQHVKFHLKNNEGNIAQGVGVVFGYDMTGPISTASFTLDGVTEATVSNINTVFSDGQWRIPVILNRATINERWTAVDGHIIKADKTEFTAEDKLIFYLDFGE